MKKQLRQEDVEAVIDLFQRLPGFGNSGDRRNLVASLLMGTPRAQAIQNRLDLDGPPFAAAAELLRVLLDFGQVEEGQEALGVFLSAASPQVGSEDEKLIRWLLENYSLQAIPPLTADHPKPAETPSEPVGVSVFLCHANEDKPKVADIHRRLKDDGFRSWLDKEDLLGGQDWQFTIRKALKSVDAVVIFLSKIAVTKQGYLNRETKLALEIADEMPEGRIFIIPVRLEECEMPERLKHLNRVDWFRSDGYERLKRALQHVKHVS